MEGGRRGPVICSDPWRTSRNGRNPLARSFHPGPPPEASEHWCWSAWFSWGKSGYTASGLRAPCPPSSLCLSLSRVACPGQMEQGGGPSPAQSGGGSFFFSCCQPRPSHTHPRLLAPPQLALGAACPAGEVFSCANLLGSQVSGGSGHMGGRRGVCLCHSFHKTQFGRNEVFSPA